MATVRTLTVAGTLLIPAAQAWAQSTTPTLTPAPRPVDAPIASLRTPASPAFALLGVEPSAIERPSTPADLAANFMSRASDFQGIPKNFAIEVSPYWLFTHSRLTWKADASRTPAASIARTLSLSMATTQGEDGASRLGIGGRAAIWSGSLSKESQTALAQEVERLSTQSALYLRLRDSFMVGVPLPIEGDPASVARFEAAKEAAHRRVLESEEYVNSSREATDLVLKRVGFFLDVAGAVTWRFPDQSWKTKDLDKAGFWITPSYEKGSLTSLGVFRYIRNQNDSTEKDVLEYGLRLMYSRQTFVLSTEILQRAVKVGEKTHRIAGVIEQRIQKSTWLVATFGRDRAHDGIEAGFLAQLGVSLNFSKDRYDFSKKD